ncbi:hypothetical protein [Paenibacillus sp. P13VS]|uniref:hypothetical protein n=1 Tax=Paenibacillus sp. P13VS TaxID=2697367 RepID=UPI00187B6564|nr:hypothetical protein [Paenibacillus sp. P13VS]MBE7682108.1 hypothetical protein [Paenibacillus sp. P13VS]
MDVEQHNLCVTAEAFHAIQDDCVSAKEVGPAGRSCVHSTLVLMDRMCHVYFNPLRLCWRQAKGYVTARRSGNLRIAALYCINGEVLCQKLYIQLGIMSAKSFREVMGLVKNHRRSATS